MDNQNQLRLFQHGKKVTGMGFYGGKAKTGKWIASLLPWSWNSLYVEPFGGMAGVLCHREPVKKEIINDLNDRTVNWWRMVRDHPDELIHLLRYTPCSRSEFRWAVDNLDNEDIGNVRRALCYQIAICQSVVKSDARNTWSPAFSISAGSKAQTSWWGNPEERVKRLAERMRFVQLECRDGLEILDTISEKGEAVVYIDPPYMTADTSAYRYRSVDVDEITDLLLQQKGFVAISGYEGEWDHLDWFKSCKETSFHGTHSSKKTNAPPGKRTEVLWTNRRPERGLT